MIIYKKSRDFFYRTFFFAFSPFSLYSLHYFKNMKSSEHLISHNEAKLSSITSPVTGISNLSLNSPVEGSYIIDDFITKQEEIELINSIDLHEWSGNGI